MPESPTCAAAASTSTTSGATPPTRAGLWRRTTLESYRSESPEWDVLIDIDELGRADDQKWVWAGANVIEPELTRALVNLSRGGSDAAVVREFDMLTREFVADGFELPEAKSQIGWADPDTVLVGTDFGADSMTESGYPRIIKRWRRGTPLSDAETIFEGSRTDVSAGVGMRTGHPASSAPFWAAPSTSGTTEIYELRGSELVRIDTPTDASLSIHREWLLIELRTDWSVGTTTYRAGSLLAADYDEFLSGTADLQVVFEPDEHTCLHQHAWTRDRLLLVTLADVASRVEIVTPGSWQREPISGIPAATNTVVVTADDTGDEFFLDSSGFQTPSRLLRGTDDGPLNEIKSAPAFFDAENLDVTAVFRAVEGRHVDPVLRREIPRCRRARSHPAGRLRRIRVVQYTWVQRRAGPAVAGPRGHVRARQYPRRRRVWAGLAHPGDARGPAQGR